MSDDDPIRPPSNPLDRLATRPPSWDRYLDEGEFARGGMGSIRRIWDEDLRRTLAMKVLLEASSEEQEAESGGSEGSLGRRVARFLEEAQVTAQLEHPGIIPVHELGLNEDGRLYFTMPLVDGGDLAEILRQVHAGEDNWTVTRAVGVLLRVCEAMGFAHSRRVVHRDLKPANIMVGSHGEVYVMDWGLARVLDREDVRDLRVAEERRKRTGKVSTERDLPGIFDSQSALRTMDGEVIGTPAYMAPEQARGELLSVGPASDVYSLGSILYHLLSGAMPYSEASKRMGALEVWKRVKSGSPDPLRDLAKNAPEELIAICERAMARQPEDRYADTNEMGEDLRAYLEGRVVRAHATGAWAEFRKWVGRNRELAATVAAALVVSFGALSWAAWNQRQANAKLEGFNAELGSANGSLLDANEKLAQSNLDLDEARRATEAKRAEADAASQRARVASEEARRSAYAAELAVAALRLDQGDLTGLRRSLDSAPSGLRGWEWRHLALHQDRSLLAFDLHGGGAHQASWRLNEGRIVAVGARGNIGVFDAQSGALLRGNRLQDWTVEALAVAPDGRRFAAGSRNGRVIIWDLDPRMAPNVIDLWDRSVSALAWSPDGRMLAAAEGPGYTRALGVESVDGTGAGRVALLNPNGRVLSYLEGHSRAVTDVEFLPDGQLLSASTDQLIKLWDVKTGEVNRSLRRHLGQIWACDTSSNGDVASCGKEDKVYLWKADSDLAPVILSGHQGSVHDVAFSADGARLATAGADGTVRVWDTETHEELVRITGHIGAVVSVEFDASGDRVLTAGWADGVRVWEARTGGPVAQVDASDSRYRALKMAYPVGNRWSPPEVAWVELPGSSGADRLLVGPEARTSSDGSVVLLRGRARRLRGTYPADLWDGRTGERLVPLLGHSARVSALAISPDGTLAATGSDDKTVRLWSSPEGQLIKLIGDIGSSVSSLAFSADGERLAIGTAAGRVLIREKVTGVSTECEGRHTGAVDALAFSSDGMQLASGGADQLVRLWHGRSGRATGQLLGHVSSVTALAFHPRGQRLVSGGRDRTVRVWNPATGDGLLTFPDHKGHVNRLAFGQSGRRLLVEIGGEEPSTLAYDTNLLDARELWQGKAVGEVDPAASEDR